MNSEYIRSYFYKTILFYIIIQELNQVNYGVEKPVII